MTNPKLGEKHICKDCDTRFYDMKKRPATCPKCGLKVKLEKATRTKRPAPEAEPAPVAPPAKKADKKDTDIEDGADLDPEALDDDDEENEDDLIEDTSDLGEDDDDLVEVREHMDDEVVDKT